MKKVSSFHASQLRVNKRLLVTKHPFAAIPLTRQVRGAKAWNPMKRRRNDATPGHRGYARMDCGKIKTPGRLWIPAPAHSSASRILAPLNLTGGSPPSLHFHGGERCTSPYKPIAHALISLVRTKKERERERERNEKDEKTMGYGRSYLTLTNLILAKR